MTHRIALCVCLFVAWPVCTAAQYFGQNKVQYERLRFQVLTTPNFDIYHYPEEADAVRLAARLVEQWRASLTTTLGFSLPGRQPLVLYASHPHFTQTQIVGGLIGEGTGGVTESLKRRMALPFAGSLGETSHVLGHELVHAFQYAAGGERIGALPLWFIEGMAEYLSLGNDDAHTAAWLRDLATREELPGFDQLDDPKFFPYRAGHAAWAYLAARFGDQIVGSTYVAAAQSGDVVSAIEATTGRDIADLSRAWHVAIRERHGNRRESATPARTVVGGGDSRGTLNVAPALSPDGRWLAFLSERGLFSIDLYVAEAATGRVVRRVTTSDTDPHIESLHFTASAGAWDRSSQRFAYTTITGGRAVLSIVDMADGPDRALRLDDVDEAWHPTWAPDGGAIAFSGLSGGVSDLYVVALDDGRTRQLTDDDYADLQPAWSPDGRALAFVTDRFTSDLTALTFGDWRLATIPASGGRVDPRPAFASGGHLNPQWDEDGTHLFFVASPDGAPNVYRQRLADGRLQQVTDVVTAVSGITSGSPAMSYATQARRLTFAVLRDGGYDLRVLEADAWTEAPAVPSVTSGPRAQLFAPTRGSADALPGTTARATPPDLPATVEPYRPALSLDLAGAGGGVGVSGRYGATFGGGMGLQFSDMLGDHNLGAYVSANGGVRDIGGQVLYVNRTSRWNWGAAALRLPYASGALTQTLDTRSDGRLVVREAQEIFRQTDTELRGIVAYPFSRALRVEFQAGGRRLDFSREVTTRTFDLSSGELLADSRQDLAAPGALTFAEASAALVYDQSTFGPTSPIAGQRYRFEVAPSVGSLQLTSVTLDYRRYVPVVRPVTLAVRAMHLARFGPGAEDPRLSELFLGYPALVRGYDAGSFDAVNDCDAATLTCPEFDALFGSRLLLANAELRFPLLGVWTGRYHYGPIPIEGFFFSDAGVAWTSASRPSFSGGDRDVVRSAGAGVRVNAFGYAIVELAMARPFDRTRKGWVFSFNLRPGY